MNIKKIIEKKLELEHTPDLIKQLNGWYVIRRMESPTSTRFNVCFKKVGFNYHAVIHDFKEGKSTLIILDKKPSGVDLIKTDIPPSQTPLEHEATANLLKTGIKADNGYLESKDLTGFSVEYAKFRLVKYRGQKQLLVPFTTFQLYPLACGGRLIAPDSSKSSIQGSSFKGAFHAHRYNRECNNFILGEGLAECVLAYHNFSAFNVLEIGSASNIFKLMPQLKNKIVYVLAENGSEEVYGRVKLQYPKTTVVYPPDKETKDFCDYFQKHGIDKTKISMLGSSIEQSQGYKPLGIENAEPVFYSKIVNEIIKKPAEQTDAIFRLSYHNPEESHTVPVKDKRAFITKIFLECAETGSYNPINVLPIGLWTFENKSFYNDGSKVVELKEDKLLQHAYSDIIKNDFLLYKVANFHPIDINSEVKQSDIEELIDIVCACDWHHAFFGKLFLGFLVQSFYVGSIEFRPHLWLLSESSHAGKSWLSSWAKRNLVLNAFARESGRSSSAGTAQAMSKLAGLLIADEFAEEDTAYSLEARKMIELLRSASTSQNPIVLGSPDQKPILGHAKFSALLSCINGREYLKKQDHDRIIFLTFGKKHSNFVQDLQPRFEDFERRQAMAGFAGYALRNYPVYQKHYHEYHKRLLEEFPKIGHKVRGLASILSGYAALTGTDKELPDLIEDFKGTSIIEEFAQAIPQEDIIEQILRTIVTEKYLYQSDPTHKTVFECLRAAATPEIRPLGLRLDEFKLNIYASEFNNFNEKYLKQTKNHLYSLLRRSKYFERISNTKYNGKRTKYFVFNLEDLMNA